MSGSSRPQSMTAFDDARTHGGPNLPGYYTGQRHQNSSRGSTDAEQFVQSKRRMAAQRERDLRNYHMEQQSQRSMPRPS